MSIDPPELLHALVSWYEAAAFMHQAMGATIAPIHRYPPDPPTRASLGAAERVIDAYHRARADGVESGTSMWTHIEAKQREFVTALEQRDVKTAQARLGAMFTNDLAYGIARLSPDAERDAHYTQLRCTDAVRSLAESCGAARVVSVEQQGPAALRNALTMDVDQALAETERLTGLRVHCAPVGANYGCSIAGRVVNVDSLLHSYTVARLAQLEAASSSTIIEIGGGYGCLADLARRAGLRDYTIYDLPWVGALQGYFLIMAAPDDEVALYGERGSGVKVLPFWRIEDLAPNSTDYVLNVNSLPEMDAAIARNYITVIARILRRRFLSINQEGMAQSVAGTQHWVSQMVRDEGTMACRSRQRFWMEQGYVEEVYARAR